jgi:hypothetical protein
MPPRDAAEILAEELDEQMHWMTVVGVWPVSRERFQDFYQVSDARMAEDLAQADAKAKGTELWVCAVYAGKLDNADTYATWVDPDA